MIDLTSNIDSTEVKRQLEEIFEAAKQMNFQTLNNLSEQDKTYWEERKKMATEAMKAIDEGQNRSLERGNFAGIAPEVIESYQEYARQLNEAQTALDALAQKETRLEDIVKTAANLSGLLDDKSKQSIDELRKIADDAKKLLESAVAGELPSDNPLGITQENFDLLAKSPEKQQELKQAIAETNRAADNSTTAFSKISQGFKDMFDSSKTLEEQKEAIKNVSTGFSDASKAVGVLSGAFTSLSDAFGGNTLSDIADGINIVSSTLSGVSTGMTAGATFGPIGAAAGGAVSGIVALTTSITKLHDNIREKKIKKYQEQIDQLKRACKDLEGSISKAYSSDKAALIGEGNEKLEQQKALIQQQIDAENDKKKTDKGRIQEWQNQIEDINKQIEANKEKQIDAIFGEDVKSAINNFATAYMNAWAQGNDKTKTSADLVKKMIQNMVTEMVKAKMASDKFMETLREKIMQAKADGAIDALEEQQLNDFIQEEIDAIDDEVAWADRFVKKEKEEEKSQQKATSKGFETMSQETGSELSGRFTVMTEQMANSCALQENILQTGNNLYNVLSDISTTMVESRDIQQQVLDTSVQTAEAAFNIRDVALQANIHLLHISNNTKASTTALQGIDSRLKRIEENTTYLK